jgi:hypothetical protein
MKTKIINQPRQLSLSVLLSTMLFFTILTTTTFADEQIKGPHLIPIKGEPFGQSYAEWVVDFTRWLYSTPYDLNPIYNPQQTDCTQPQHGKVWFVGTAAGVNPNVKCEVPEGKAVMVHVGFYPDTYPCPDPTFKPDPGQSLGKFLTLDAKKVIDSYFVNANRLPNGLTIDGKVIFSPEDAVKQRVSTGLFSLIGDLSLKPTDSCITGKRQWAVTDGFFGIIEGLPRGEHKFIFTDGSTMKVKVVHR